MEDDDGFATVKTYIDEERALEAARLLVGSGFGADVVAGRFPLEDDGEPTDAFQLRVVRTDLVRACEVLGVEVPVSDDDDEVEAGPPWKTIVGIWLVAMIVIPLAAFWLTVNLAD